MGRPPKTPYDSPERRQRMNENLQLVGYSNVSGLVERVARGVSAPGERKEELRAELWVEALQLLGSYRPELGVPFHFYAWRPLRSAASRWRREEDRWVHAVRLERE